MKCSQCKNLNLKDKKCGRESGTIYWCNLKKEYCYANEECCSCFKTNKKIDKDTIKKIEKESIDYYDNITPIWVYILFIIILLVFGFITNSFAM